MNSIKPMRVLFLSFLIICACGHQQKIVKVRTPITVTSSVPYIPITPANIDTNHVLNIKHDIDKEIRKEYVIIDKQASSPAFTDTLLKMFLAQSKVLFRVIDTSRNRKHEKDSLFALVKRMDAREQKFEQAAQKANYYREQNKTYNSSIDYQYWLAFAAVLIFQMLIYYNQRIATKKLKLL